MDARIIITPPKSYTYFQRTEHAGREIARARLRNEKSRCGARGPRSNAGVIMRARTLDLARSPRTRIYIHSLDAPVSYSPAYPSTTHGGISWERRGSTGKSSRICASERERDGEERGNSIINYLGFI